MPDISRRRLLQGAGTAAAAAFAADSCPECAQGACRRPSRGGSFRDIKHVVILMQENRSFDHYFGTLPECAASPTRSDHALLRAEWSATSRTPATRTGTCCHSTSTPRPPARRRSRPPATPGTCSTRRGTAADGQLAAGAPRGRRRDGPFTMGYLDRDDIPFHYALAENFTICDNYHCSLLGPTWPNRLYLMSAWIDPEGVQGGPIISNQHTTPYELEDLPGGADRGRRELAGLPGGRQLRLQRARVLQLVPDRAGRLAAVPERAPHLPGGQFEWDALHDRLPAVSWIIPTSYQSEHPDYTPAAGADFVASKIDAIAANPDVWAKTVFILNYDENDGLFDHVVPPTPPAGTPGELHPAARLRLADRRRLPGALPHRLAVDDGRLDRQRDLRPHLHAAVPRAAHRRDDPEHHPLAPADLRQPVSAFGGSRPGYGGPRLPDTKRRWPRPSRRSTTCPRRRSRPATRPCRCRPPAATPVRVRSHRRQRRPTDMASPFQRHSRATARGGRRRGRAARHRRAGHRVRADRHVHSAPARARRRERQRRGRTALDHHPSRPRSSSSRRQGGRPGGGRGRAADLRVRGGGGRRRGAQGRRRDRHVRRPATAPTPARAVAVTP